MDAIAGIILAGGRSSRMGGGDKTLLEIGGRTLLGLAADRLRPQVAALAISANDGSAERHGLPVLADHRIGRGAGPLAGILAGMEWAAGLGLPLLASAAGDTPFAPRDLVARLAAARGDGVAIAASGGRPHPVFGLWPVPARAELVRRIEADGDLSVIGFARALGLSLVEFSHEGGRDPFFNVNTPAEVEEARRMAGTP